MQRHPLLASSAFAILLGSAAAFTACGGSGETPTTSAASSTTGSTTATTTGGTGGAGGSSSSSSDGGGGTDVPPPAMRKKIAGDLTWKVTFDDAAKMAGASDCSYSRHYDGYEDRSAPWLCPDCETTFKVDVQITAGLDDCFTSQVSSNPPAKLEWVGYTKSGVFRRGLGELMTEQGTATPGAAGFDMANAVPDLDAKAGGKMSFAVSGSFATSDEEGDVMNGFVPPATYACGWPKAEAPPYTGDYVLAKGKTMPDGLFKDACNETVRLHELAGAYLFVEMSARNCGPCQQMAKAEEKFIADMKAQNIDVRVVTLLCPALEDTIGTTTTVMLKNWTKQFMLTSPVLADRGWGLTVLAPAVSMDSVGYPTWALVDPKLKVLDFDTGFGTYADIQAAILADAKP
ncbi:MAG: hypothetical protein ABI193_23100 [Minicystis sp.]